MLTCTPVSQGIGRPVIGLVSDRVGRINVAGLSTLTAGVAALFVWVFGGKSYAGLIIYALFGMFAGSLWPTVAPVGAEVVGLKLLPAGRSDPLPASPPLTSANLYTYAALSIYWLVLVPPATFAEVIGLGLVTPGVDGYLHVQLFAGIIFLAAFACGKYTVSVCPTPTLGVFAHTDPSLASTQLEDPRHGTPEPERRAAAGRYSKC
jgi:MFS family permease